MNADEKTRDDRVGNDQTFIHLIVSIGVQRQLNDGDLNKSTRDRPAAGRTCRDLRSRIHWAERRFHWRFRVSTCDREGSVSVDLVYEEFLDDGKTSEVLFFPRHINYLEWTNVMLNPTYLFNGKRMKKKEGKRKRHAETYFDSLSDASTTIQMVRCRFFILMCVSIGIRPLFSLLPFHSERMRTIEQFAVVE